MELLRLFVYHVIDFQLTISLQSVHGPADIDPVLLRDRMNPIFDFITLANSKPEYKYRHR